MRTILSVFFAGMSVLAATNQMVIKLPCNDVASDLMVLEQRHTGMRWCDSADGNKIKEWDGASWTEVAGSTAGAMSNYPLQFARPFVDGEILHYPRVSQDGTPLTTQAVIKQRYPSGYVKHAIISVVLPVLSRTGSTLTFQNQSSGNDAPPTRDALLTAIPAMDANVTFTPDANNCPGCTPKTVSARTMLQNAPANLPKCEGTNRAPCLWTHGSVATTVILADHTTKAYDVGWKQANATTWGRPVLAITNISGRPASPVTAVSCASNVCTISVTDHKLAAGDLVTISGTGIANLDGASRFVGSAPDANTFTVSQSFNTGDMVKTNLTLSGSSSVGTVTPTRVTVTFSNAPATAANHPLWANDQVSFANVGGSGLNGTKSVKRTPTANTFQVDHTPTGAYTTGGTATLTVITVSKPDLHIASSAGLAAPLWVRDSLSATYTKNNRFCSIDNSSTPPRVKSGDYDCREFTINETSLSETATSVTVPNASQHFTTTTGAGSWTGWSYQGVTMWIIDDGVNPMELVEVYSVNNDTVTFWNASGARTLKGGTRSAHSGTIKLRSFGRFQAFSNPKRNGPFGTDVNITTSPNAYPSSYVEITSQADQVFRTVRPQLHLTIWHTLNKYEVRVKTEISDTQRWGDQFYATRVTVGSSTPVTRYPVQAYERSGVWPHPAGTSWSRKYWGSGWHYPPADIDHNMDYVRDTRFTYYFDLDKLLTAGGRDNEINDWTKLHKGYRDLLGVAYYQPYMGDYGGRPEIGPYTRATTRAIMSGGLADSWKLWWIAGRHGEQLGTFPYHFREGSPDPALEATNPSDPGAQTRYIGRSGCTALGDACDQLDVDQISGLGRVASIRAHPLLDLRSVLESNQSGYISNTADRVPIRGAMHSVVTQVDTAHTYDHFTALFALTGDFHFLEEIWMWAGFESGQEAVRTTYGRRGPDGSYGCCGYGETRAHGRKLIKKANVAFVTPDGLPEKTYFSQHVKEFIVAETDSREMTSTYGSEHGMRALRDWAKNFKNKEHWLSGTEYHAPSPLGLFVRGGGAGSPLSDQEVNGAVVRSSLSIWTQYILTFALGRAEETGFTGAKTLKEWLGKFPVNVLTTPGINKYQAAMYYGPTTVKGWATETAIHNDLNVTPQSDHCRATGVTTSDFMVGTAPQKAGEYIKNLKAWQCANSNISSSNTTGGVTYYEKGYKGNFWRYANAPYNGCDSQASYSLHLLSALSVLRGVPNWDAAWNVASTEILNGSCAGSWRDNPQFSLLPRPAEPPTTQTLGISTNTWNPSCTAANSTPVTGNFAVDVTPQPAVVYTLNSSTPWLSFTSGGTGTTPASATASINCSGLAPGSYPVTVTASSPGVNSGDAEIVLTVTPTVVETVTVRQMKASRSALAFMLRRSTTEECSVTLEGQSAVVVPAGLFVEPGYKGGLTPGTTYNATASCASGASWSGTLATLGTQTGAAMTTKVTVRPPSYLAAHNALVEYGPDPTVSEGAASGACSSGCTLSLPGNGGELKFYRLKWRDSGNNVLATSSIRVVPIE